MSLFTCSLPSPQAGLARTRATLAASVAALLMSVAPVEAATITKVFDFAFAGSYINDGYPQLTGSVQVTFEQGLNYTGPGTATANGEITVDALELYRRNSADGPGILITDQAADVLRIQYSARDGAVSVLALSSWIGSANPGGFQIRFRAPADILTQPIQTNGFTQFQTCGAVGATHYSNPVFQACHGGSVTVSDFVPPTAVVPVPAALPLLFSGLLALFGIRRLGRHAS